MFIGSLPGRRGWRAPSRRTSLRRRTPCAGRRRRRGEPPSGPSTSSPSAATREPSGSVRISTGGEAVSGSLADWISSSGVGARSCPVSLSLKARPWSWLRALACFSCAGVAAWIRTLGRTSRPAWASGAGLSSAAAGDPIATDRASTGTAERRSAVLQGDRREPAPDLMEFTSAIGFLRSAGKQLLQAKVSNDSRRGPPGIPEGEMRNSMARRVSGRHPRRLRG